MGWRNLLACIRPVAVEMDNTDDTVMEDGERRKNKIIKRSTKTQTSETPRFIRRITACFSGKFPGMRAGILFVSQYICGPKFCAGYVVSSEDIWVYEPNICYLADLYM